MTNSHESAGEKVTKIKGMEDVIRIGLIVLLLVFCFHVLRPFIELLIWALLIAVVSHPAYTRLESVLQSHHNLSALLFTLLILVILIVPIVLFAETTVISAEKLMAGLEKGTIMIPPPPETIASWPFIGIKLDAIWRDASQNYTSIPTIILPYLKTAGAWLLSTTASAAVGMLQIILAVLIAGVMLARGEQLRQFANKIVIRLAGDKGVNIWKLTKETIQTVSQGVLGVAFIQALLAGIGFLVVGVPAAGIWALCSLVLCIIQIGLIPVTIPVVVYVFYSSDLVIAVPFLIWCIFISLIDNVLKPIFFSRGVDVPFWVIFVGAIGGLVAFGFFGLFIGAVVLVMTYTLFIAWLNEDSEQPIVS